MKPAATVDVEARETGAPAGRLPHTGGRRHEACVTGMAMVDDATLVVGAMALARPPDFPAGAEPEAEPLIDLHLHTVNVAGREG